MKHAVLSILIVALLANGCPAAEPPAFANDNDRLSYSLGYQAGAGFRNRQADLNRDLVVKGLLDALSGTEPLMSPKEMQETQLESYKRDLRTHTAQKREAKERYRGEGRDFLEQNAQQPGVITLPSGLQYKVIREGAGKMPGPQDLVVVNYRGTLLDGTEFDSTYRSGKTATLSVNGVIAGWTEALQRMKEGAKWQLFIPADLAYGERGPLADRTVIFDVELIEIK